MRKMKKIGMLLVLLWMLTACGKTSEVEDPLQEVDASEVEAQEDASDSIFVYVCGAVEAEGVYELATGSRVYEAIEMAGGFRGDAATNAVNQAEVLADEAKVYVPTIAEAQAEQTADNGKVNLNTATKEKLMSLPGVGESRADSIISSREEKGPFKKIEDIMQISGIKEGLFEKIKDFITI